MPRDKRSIPARMRAPLVRYMKQYARTRERQEAVLRGMVRRARDTQFGRDHGFSSIRSPRDYGHRVPIRDWSELQGYFDRTFAGETAVLTAEQPLLYHQTSGTSGKNKMIPVTERCDRLSARTHHIWVYKAMAENPGLMRGGVLGIVNGALEGHSPAGVPVGSVSGNVFVRRMPSFVRRSYSHPHETTSIPDPDQRRYTLMRLAVQRPCSFIFTGNAGAILNLFEFADMHADRLIRDIHDGTLDCAAALNSAVRDAVRPFLHAQPERARAMEAGRKRAGRLSPADYWPGLSVIGCWLGGTVGRIAGQLRDWCPPQAVLRDIGYMASEGAFTIPAGNGQPDGTLALHSIFFEFVPVSEHIGPDTHALGAHELVQDEEYQVVITTTGGLYRYAINDIVRVTGFYDGSPLIRFVRKGEYVKNIAGELLNVDHVLDAMKTVGRDTGLRIRHLQVQPRPEERRYAVHVELESSPPEAALRTLPERIDAELCRVNEVYAEVRRESLLEPVTAYLMHAGWLDAITSDWVASGRRESQFKPPVLVDRIDHAEMTERQLGEVH